MSRGNKFRCSATTPDPGIPCFFIVVRAPAHLGSEMLAMQGLSCSDLTPEVVASESTLADLSGNSFSAPVIMACLLTMLTALPLDTESESEELAGIRTMFQMGRFS